MTQLVEVECNVCRGTKQIQVQRVCIVCGGKGEDALGNACTNCKGERVMWVRERCGTCGGTGRLRYWA